MTSPNNNKKSNDFCVLIPVYNAVQAIRPLIKEVQSQPVDIIVVDDGSIDGTYKAIQDMEKEITILKHPTRMGKGEALKTGFDYAKQKDYEGVITLDGDGQHDPQEIPVFIQTFKQDNRMQLGSRMHHTHLIPWDRSSSMKVARLYISYATWQWIEDTQCGYRLYPMPLIRRIKLSTAGYTTETEFLIKAASLGYKFNSIPIKVIYFSKGTQLSHLRPIKDVTCISIYVTLYLANRMLRTGINFLANKLNLPIKLKISFPNFGLPPGYFLFAAIILLLSFFLQPFFICWLGFKKVAPKAYKKILARLQIHVLEKILVGYLFFPLLLFLGVLNKLIHSKGVSDRIINGYYGNPFEDI